MRKLMLILAMSAALNAQGTGDGAIEAAKNAKDSNWKNWTFASVLVVTASLGIYLVAINSGRNYEKP